MKATISILRIAILVTLGFFAMLFIVGELETTTNWLITTVITKSLGVGLAVALVKLYNHWSKTDAIIMAADKLLNNHEEI